MIACTRLMLDSKYLICPLAAPPCASNKNLYLVSTNLIGQICICKLQRQTLFACRKRHNFCAAY